MTTFTRSFTVNTAGENSYLDLTAKIRDMISRSDVMEGVASIFLYSTTASLIICENETGLLSDIVERARAFAPDEFEYRHNLAWHDDNGRSHVKATLFRQDLTIPIRGGDIDVGTWQSIFLLEFDVRPRERRLSITAMGE